MILPYLKIYGTAQLPLQRLDIAGETIGLHKTCKNMEHMLFNQADDTEPK